MKSKDADTVFRADSSSPVGSYTLKIECFLFVMFVADVTDVENIMRLIICMVA